MKKLIIISTHAKVKSKWWFTLKVPNGYIKVGEIFNGEPERVRLKIKMTDTDTDVMLREDEAQAVAYGLNKTLFEIIQK